jgi:hypothetical protein
LLVQETRGHSPGEVCDADPDGYHHHLLQVPLLRPGTVHRYLWFKGTVHRYLWFKGTVHRYLWFKGTAHRYFGFTGTVHRYFRYKGTVYRYFMGKNELSTSLQTRKSVLVQLLWAAFRYMHKGTV